METKFTKGKWSVGEFAQKVWADNRKGCVASCSNEYHNDKYYIGFDLEEIHANALLISKAPEMFEMLESVLELQKEFYGSGMNTHLALISKSKEIEQLLKEATEL